MKVIFLDFDGVLNSEGSFVYESHRRKRHKEQGVKGPVAETLCNVCTANFSEILIRYPDVKIVLSTTWRELFPLQWLKDKLESYHIDSSRVIGITPTDFGGHRGAEIQLWLNEHPEVKHYIVIDDNDWGIKDYHGEARFVKTSWEDGGLTSGKAAEAILKLSSKHQKWIEEYVEETKKKDDSGSEST